MSAFIDLTGGRFGRLIVVERDKSKIGTVWWVCRCDCGQTTSIRATCFTRR